MLLATHSPSSATVMKE